MPVVRMLVPLVHQQHIGTHHRSSVMGSSGTLILAVSTLIATFTNSSMCGMVVFIVSPGGCTLFLVDFAGLSTSDLV